VEKFDSAKHRIWIFVHYLFQYVKRHFARGTWLGNFGDCLWITCSAAKSSLACEITVRCVFRAERNKKGDALGRRKLLCVAKRLIFGERRRGYCEQRD
jgi:hypothetical protein